MCYYIFNMDKPFSFPGPDEGDEPIQSAPQEPTPYKPRGVNAMSAADLEKRVAELEASMKTAPEAEQSVGEKSEPEMDMTTKIAEWRAKSEQLTKEIVAAEAEAEAQHRLYIRTRDVIQALPANKKEEALVQQAAKLRDEAFKRLAYLQREREVMDFLVDNETKRLEGKLTDADFVPDLKPGKTPVAPAPNNSVQAMIEAERVAVEARNRAHGISNVEADITAAVSAAGVTVVPPPAERNTPSNIDRRSEREQTPAELCLRAIRRYNAVGLTDWANEIQEHILPHMSTLTNEQSAMIQRERVSGKILLFMPSAGIQLATAQRVVAVLKRSGAGDNYIAWGQWNNWITNRESLLVGGSPNRAHVAFIDGGDRPNPRTTNKTVPQQLEELAQINRELGQQSLPAVDSANPLEYLALQTEVDTPIDTQTYTRFLKLVAGDNVALAYWQDAQVELSSGHAGFPFSGSGFRLARRVTF